MEGRKAITVGTRVKIKHQHWLRALEEGVVVEYRPHARNSWLVKFEHGYPGGGIDGDKLYFAEGDFSEVERRDSPRAQIREPIPEPIHESMIHEPMITADDFMTTPNGRDLRI